MIQKPKGTKDILPDESYKWQYIENNVKSLLECYGLREIRVPVLNTQSYFQGVLERLLMLFKKRCILLRIRVEEALH